MPFKVSIDEARKKFPEYVFIKPLTPSEQKAAFHVKDKDKKDLCLKIINPDFEIERLKREIIALQKLSHPNVVNLIEYTFSTSNNNVRHFIIEEFVEGSDLSILIESRQDLNLQNWLDIFIQFASGLSAVGKLRIVHRDLKPSNIRIRSDNTPVIIDFGTARILNLPDLTKTSDGAAIGTPTYFAPEQFLGTKHDIDHRTDIFSFGILLYEGLIGSHPFFDDGMTYADLQDKICNSIEYQSNQKFQELPKLLQILMRKMLDKERFRRPSNSSQIMKILEKIRSEL